MQSSGIQFYVHWLPTHNVIPATAGERLSQQLVTLEGSPTDSTNLAFGSNGVIVCHSLNLRGRDFQVAVYCDGVFLVQTSVRGHVSIKESQEFVLACGQIYESLREALHVHLFKHRLTKEFPIADVRWEPFRADELRNWAIKELHSNYLRELNNQVRELGHVRRTFVNTLRNATTSIPRLPWGWLLYLVRGLPSLLQRRSDLCSVLSRICNAQGVQTYLNAFTALTSSEERGTQQRDFLDAMAAYHTNMTEFRDTIGTYTIQSLALTLAILALGSPFMIIFFSQLIDGIALCWKASIFALLLGLYYTVGYFATVRLAERTNELTYLFFE